MYLQVEDKIDISIVNESPVQYRYINIDTYQSWQNTISGKISKKNFGINVGFSLLGRSLVLQNINDDKYRYSAEVNASAYYNLLKTKTSFAIYFKGVGKSYSIMEDKTLGIKQNILVKRDAFSLLDFSIAQKLFAEHITLSLGVKNILNISNVSNLSVGGGTHGTANAGERLFYGRSYFGKLNFNF
jgi:outer membrane receptor for ferrienterochelin and colicins